MLYGWTIACQLAILGALTVKAKSYNPNDAVPNLKEGNVKLQAVETLMRRERREALEDGFEAEEFQGNADGLMRDQGLKLAKLIKQFRRKRSVADIIQNKAGTVERLYKILLARQKRHLSERDRSVAVDPFAFQAKDYNYYDYNNMLTAITLPSSTIKFVERVKKNNPEVARANDINMFNRKLKNVFGGFHNDSEMLIFLKRYKNYTMEEKKHLFWDDFMQKRCEHQVKIWEANWENYRKHYRSFREKSNREGHRFVDPETEDQSDNIPEFEEPYILNYTMLYGYFRWVQEQNEITSDPVEPEPVNHYMPANHTDSPEHEYRSGEMEAFQSDYEEDRINRSCFTEPVYPEPVLQRRRRSDPKLRHRIDINLVDRVYEDNDERLEEMESKQKKTRNSNKRTRQHTAGRLSDELNEIKELGRAAAEPFDELSKNLIKAHAIRPVQNINQINIMFQINQNNPTNNEVTNRNNTNVQRVSGECSSMFSTISEILNLLKNNVNMGVVQNILCKEQIQNSREKSFNVIFDLVRSILNSLNHREATQPKSIKELEIYDVNNDAQPKRKVLSGSKRYLKERKFLTLSKAVKTVDNNDDSVLHLYLVPMGEKDILGDARYVESHKRTKRDVNFVDKTLDQCPEMKAVFTWSDAGMDEILDRSNLIRRKRENSEEVKGYQDPVEATGKPQEPSNDEQPSHPSGVDSKGEPEAQPSDDKTPEPMVINIPKVRSQDSPNLSLDHEKARENQGTSVPIDPTNIQKSFQEQAAENELQQPFAGFSEHQVDLKRRWTREYLPPGFTRKSFIQRGSPYVVTRRITPILRNRQTYEMDSVTKVVEPRFVRIIYNGKGYARHVHFITNREFQKKKYWADSNRVRNVYRENFELETNETVKTIARDNHKVPTMIQNHFADGKSNVTRYINLYYDADGDLIYRTNLQKYRIPVAKQWLPNKYYYRNYYHKTFNMKVLTNMREPILVQLHYKV